VQGRQEEFEETCKKEALELYDSPGGEELLGMVEQIQLEIEFFRFLTKI
jgi:hypothetical protein